MLNEITLAIELEDGKNQAVKIVAQHTDENEFGLQYADHFLISDEDTGHDLGTLVFDTPKKEHWEYHGSLPYEAECAIVSYIRAFKDENFE